MRTFLEKGGSEEKNAGVMGESARVPVYQLPCDESSVEGCARKGQEETSYRGSMRPEEWIEWGLWLRSRKKENINAGTPKGALLQGGLAAKKVAELRGKRESVSRVSGALSSVVVGPGPRKSAVNA